MSIKVNSRTTIHHGKVFELIRENVTLDNGTTTDMEFIEHPGAAAIVPLLSENRVVMLKQYRHALKKVIWEIPAGTLDPEEEALSCAKRELVEETGYSAEQWHRLGEITPVPGYSNESIHIFLARKLKPAAQNLDADEVIQIQAVEFQTVLEMIGKGEVQDAKSIAGLLMASAWLENRNKNY